MSRKHAELEREFIDELAKRTGRSLDAWMAAIDTARLSDRNAIIDWLRPQGLTFAHASWLERIHHNGGRPIYVGTATQPMPAGQTAGQEAPSPSRLTAFQQPAPAVTARPAPPITLASPKAPSPHSQEQTPTAASIPPPSSDTADPFGALLARGKGLRPLADRLLREITRAAPGATTAAAGDLILHANPTVFACLHIGAKELRLGLTLEGMNLPPPFLPPRIPGAPTGISHMLVLNDARQLDNALSQLIVLANAKANPT